MVIKGRIKTVPLKQWLVGRELRKRIARIFRERGIRMPVPQMSVKLASEERAALTSRYQMSGLGLRVTKPARRRQCRSRFRHAGGSGSTSTRSLPKHEGPAEAGPCVHGWRA